MLRDQARYPILPMVSTERFQRFIINRCLSNECIIKRPWGSLNGRGVTNSRDTELMKHIRADGIVK